MGSPVPIATGDRNHTVMPDKFICVCFVQIVDPVVVAAAVIAAVIAAAATETR